MSDEIRMTVRLPRDADAFLIHEAREHFTSKNAQVVRAIREQMKRKGAAEAATSPRHGSENSSAGALNEQHAK